MYSLPVKEAKFSHAVPFEAKLFFAVILLLSWPVAICFLLYTKPSISYWFGEWELVLGAGIIIWTIFNYFAYVIGAVGKGTATLLLLVLPCTVLAIVCEMQDLQFQFIATSLRSHDCNANKQKAYIQEAWLEASRVSAQCTKALSADTGAPEEEIMKVRKLEECAGYIEARKQYSREFSYLKGLEEKYTCGGWCEPNYPLWISATTPLDSCAISAGRAMTNSISQMGTEVAVYAFIVLVSVSSWLLLSPKWLDN